MKVREDRERKRWRDAEESGGGWRRGEEEGGGKGGRGENGVERRERRMGEKGGR